MHPTPRAIALAAAGLPVALLPVFLGADWWVAWLAWVGGMALLLGADALLALSPGRVSCAIELPETLFIGAEGEARLRVRAATSLDLTAVVDLSGVLEPQPPLAGRATPRGATIPFCLRPSRRGTATVEAAWLRYRGPLGMIARVVRKPLGERLTVVPNLLPVKAAALRFAADRQYRAGMKIERYRGDGTEFDSLKEFLPGDDQRALDWKASARHRQLVARQFRAERNHQIVLAIDTGHLMCEALGGVPKLDHAINAALLLAYVSLRSGDRVGLCTFDARIGLYCAPDGGMATHRALTRLSGRVRYSQRETNFTLALTTLAQRLRRRSLVVVLTDFVDTITAELMVENLSRLARRHLLIFAALRDPELAATAEAAPADLDALNRAVVAGGLLRDREVVLSRLRRLGVLTIDAEPARLTPRLVNSYLDVKRRERI